MERPGASFEFAMDKLGKKYAPDNILWYVTYPYSMSSKTVSNWFLFSYPFPLHLWLVFFFLARMVSPEHESDGSLDCWPIQPSLIATYGTLNFPPPQIIVKQIVTYN